MELFAALDSRHSIRKYTDVPVPQAVLDRLANAVYTAPSACNRQPYRFLAIRSDALKTAVCEICTQAFLEQAPVIIAAVADDNAAWKRPADRRSLADVDVAIAMQQLMLAATAEGLGTCWVAAFDPEPLNKLFQLAPGQRVLALSPLGYPAEAGSFARTKRPEELFKVID